MVKLENILLFCKRKIYFQRKKTFLNILENYSLMSKTTTDNISQDSNEEWDAMTNKYDGLYS